jgi:hypothetical protein
MMPWLRAAGVGVALAGCAWLVPWHLTVSTTSSLTDGSARVVVSLIALIGGVALTRLLQRRRAALAARERRGEQLEQRIASLEQAVVIAPTVGLRFEFDTATQLARLHVTNDGADGTVRAPVTIDGPLSSRPNGQLFAQWEQTDAPSMSLSRGATRTLRIARLDVSSFPFAQWCVPVTTDEGTSVLYAMHASVIGGAPETQAPPLFLDVAIVDEEDQHLCGCTIVLHPFDAERLRS